MKSFGAEQINSHSAQMASCALAPARNTHQPPRLAGAQTYPVVILPRTEADKIIHGVARKHGLSVKSLIDPCRKKMFVRPRQEAWYQLYLRTNFSLPQIGRKFGGRHHTSVLHGIRAHAKRYGLPGINGANREEMRAKFMEATHV